MKFTFGAWYRTARALLFFSVLIASATPAALSSTAPRLRSRDADANAARAKAKPVNQEMTIPPGTILPIRLGSLSSEKAKQGDLIKARIMQDVPLENGSRLRAGSKVVGRIIAVNAASSGTRAALTMRFDTILQGKESIPVVTHVRAMASTLEVESAQVPPIGPSESDVYDWLPTTQIGGEIVYGKWGDVFNGDRVVGRSVGGDAVLAQPNAQEGTKCQGPVEGNDRPQAFWVFSSDACGAYGFPQLMISHSGRTDPSGEIVLEAERGPVKIRSGSGMLLRVQR